MHQITVGIDNGQSGSIAILGGDSGVFFDSIPTKDALHYGKKGTVGQRLDREALRRIICGDMNPDREGIIAYVERHFTGRFMNAVIPAQRFFEATIITLEDMGIGYEVIDSGVWQKPMLGAVGGSAALKKASLLRGIQLYPKLEAAIRSHKDADGLLIAHHFHHRHE
jgi:hypothetical protein